MVDDKRPRSIPNLGLGAAAVTSASVTMWLRAIHARRSAIALALQKLEHENRTLITQASKSKSNPTRFRPK
jgi:hypothetical protein